MMATEGTVVEKADDVLKDPSQNQSPTNANPQNGPFTVADAVPGESTPNGTRDDIENKQITDIVDELVNSAEASVSGGSDTEASKTRFGDDKGHGRTSSAINKPKGFKSVSVNKTFLASKGANAAAVASSSSRPESAAGSTSSTPTPANAASSASKLKLVAKSGTSLGGSTKTLSTNGKPASAPDGNSVWNKNRPTPVPEPKKLSDEELMSQYGIHMADRLRPEDANKNQSNWADIDDDEEWAPETITWTDGTQITLPQADEMGTSPAPAHASLHQPSEAPPKTRSPGPPNPVSTTGTTAPPPPTRPDAPTSARKGLVLKGAPEKPQLVAKPPTQQGPAKSPWQTLPPVEKAPMMDQQQPLQQQHMHPPGSRAMPNSDPYSMRSMPPPPAKEIAADDFSRAHWRDSRDSGRELYNSHSGRLEPVMDRRGSRNEGHGRQVLQRPSAHEQEGPAGPSAAFQTSRNVDMPPGRRRTSSNVSGGSGALASRLGRPHDIAYPPPNDLLATRSGSMAGGTESPASARTFSPTNNQHPTPRGQPSQPWRASPNQSFATPHQNAPPNETSAAAPAVSLEQDLEMQKKIMREKREMAMKRRMEQEAQEEAAKRERIRLKLEAMGPPPERKSTKKEDTKEEVAKVPESNHRHNVPASLAAKSPSTQTSQHAAGPLQDELPARPDVPSLEVKGPVTFDQAGPPTRAMPDSSPQGHPAPPSQPKGWEPSQGSQPLTWSSSAPGRNVWGAPGDRSLGNGTFNSDLSQVLPEPLASLPSMPPRPTPIGPPRSSQEPAPRAEPAPGRFLPIGPPRIRDQPQTSSNPWRNYNAAEEDRTMAKVKRAADEAKLKHLADQGLSVDSTAPAMRDTWKPVQLGNDGKRFREPVQPRMYGKGMGEPAPSGPWSTAGSSASLHAHDSTPVETRDLASSDFRQPVANGIRDDYSRPAAPGPVGAPLTPGSMSQSRGGSRFFPAPRDVRHDDMQFSVSSRTKSPTPPPPTMEDHPVYEGNPDGPRVSLPRGPIVVRLPPSASGHGNSAAAVPATGPGKQAPASFAAAAATGAASAAPRGQGQTTFVRPPSQGSHGFTSQSDWQDRINNLMGKPKSFRSYHVDSLSIHPIDHGHESQNSATVSLPSLSSSCSTVSDCTTREMAEECFEEQEMGSLPTVCLPLRSPDTHWQKCEVDWQPLTSKYRVQSTSSDSPRFFPEIVGGKTVIRVMAPGMPESKTIPAPSSTRMTTNRTRSNPRRQGQNPRGNSRHTSSRGGPRGGRDTSNDHGSSDRPSTSRGGRGGSFRARSENWTRQASSSAH